MRVSELTQKIIGNSSLSLIIVMIIGVLAEAY